MRMHIALGSDHGGFEQKEAIAAWLDEHGYSYKDFGTFSTDSVDYPDYAIPVAESVAEGAADCGILVCGTGLGMQLAANKVHGIRAVSITSVPFAKLAREHNDANVLALSGRFVEPDVNLAIVEAFLTTGFSGGRHARRIAKIMNLEQGE